jgi:hypothetical protein
VPPGFTKSRLVNVLWPAWEWGPKNRPDLRYMAWSYSPKLSEEQNDDCRKVIESPLPAALGRSLRARRDTDAKSYYKNDKGGWRARARSAAQAPATAPTACCSTTRTTSRTPTPRPRSRRRRAGSRASLPTRVRNASGEHQGEGPVLGARGARHRARQDPDDSRPVTVSATIGIMQRVHLHDISGVILKNPRSATRSC